MNMHPEKASSPDVLRVLLLEDSETDAELIRYALTSAIPGLQIREVVSRDDFIIALEDFSPHIILSDYIIPGFEGRSALEIVRKRHPDLLFIFVSGALGEELAVELLRAGATDYILKDRMSRLPSAVIRSLDEARERAELAERTRELQKRTNQLAQEVEARRQTERDLLNSQGDLRRLALELSKAEDRELRRIALEIHERIGQNLVLALMSLEDLRNRRNLCELDDAVALLDRTIRETRSLALELSPPVLYEFGIFAALEWLAERVREKARIPILLQLGKRDPLPSLDLQVFLYKAVQELILNAVRHAGPKRVIVRSGIEPEGIYAEVEDDGSGFEPSLAARNEKAGWGLFSIRERLSHLGGQLSIKSGSMGSLLRITLPATPHF